MAVRVISALVCALALLAVPAGNAATATTPASARSGPTAVAASPSYAPPIPGVRRAYGHLGASTQQVIVVTSSSWTTTYAVVGLWSRSGTGWHRDALWLARVGYGGLVIGTQRVQGTGTTPAGAYPITSAFGILGNPGTALPYTKVDDDQWWVEDRTSAFYNQMRRARLGGFHVTTAGYNGSEHLARMGAQYDYAAVIDFNRPHPVVGRGAGIFLHAFGSGATGGCVSVSLDHMRTALRWLRPALHPMIVIGPSAWLAA